jgi:hypothetical protein
MASQNLNVGTAANANNGDTLREAFIKVKQMFAEVYGQTYSEQGDLSGTELGIDHGQLADRYTEEVSIDTYNGTVNFDCSLGSTFKLGDDIDGAYTIKLINYKLGQIVSIYPVTGNETLNLDAGTGTSVFNKIGGVDYEDDGTSDNIIQIECVDDDAADPVFFYSIATYTSDKSDI